MNKFKAVIAGLMLAVTVVGVADAKSRVSSSSRSYSAPKSHSAPKVSAPKAASKSSNSSYNGNSFFSSKPAAPKATAPSLNLNKPATVQSKPTLKSLGFTKPAPVQAVRQPSVNVSPKPASNSWFGQKKVVSTPTKTVVTRKVASPVAYKNTYRPRNVTVIQRNYYGGNSYGYNRGYGGGYYGNQYGHSDLGTSMLGGALGAFGGMMIYDALSNNSDEKRLEQKMDQILVNQQVGNQQMNNLQQQAYSKPQCFLPPDAPLMMDPKFYCGGK